MGETVRKIVRRLPTVKTADGRATHVMYVKSGMPYVSGIKRVVRWLEALDARRGGAERYVTLLGLGRAAERTLSVACHFQDARRVEVRTLSTEVLDELAAADADDAPTALRARSVSGVEVRIYAL
ncbi:AaceriAGR216Wp [[Ashbya] aceris (nom. inval.)]|nr:AaceriAGR216Wp [[Ashbya] aceris (nom. inval.)]